ncbi:MAG: NAD-dependent epimerase/dehydratase family protein [Zoogloeaceae bacterium]|nr:NAD-dependent epimerase/dehydratase family protein [Zoogloeaceae bacterium]
MKILVTGANGFIGRALSADLEAKGHEVARAMRSLSGIGAGRGEVAVGDIDEKTDWRAALEGCEAVAHLAGRAHVMRERLADPLGEFRRINVGGTLNLARQAAALGARRFVFVSSIKVNGENTTGRPPFSEVDIAAPVDAYAISKWEAEQGLLAIGRETGMAIARVRPPLVYGPGVKGNFAALLRWARRNLPLPLDATRNRRSFVALENLVSFLALCVDLSRADVENRLFLLADGEDVSTTELLKRLAQALGKRPWLLPVPEKALRLTARALGKAAIAERLLDSLAIDASAARALGWRPVISMADELRKMAEAEPSP